MDRGREGDGLGSARGRGWKLECREEGDDEDSGVSPSFSLLSSSVGKVEDDES